MTRKVILLTLALVLCCGVGFCEDVFNVDCFFGWDGCYRPMQWTTVNVGIASTLTKPFQGVLSVSAQQDGLNNLIINHEFVLTPNMRLNIPLVTKFAYAADKCLVRITTPKGKTVWSKSYNLWDYSQNKGVLHSLSESDLLVGLVGQRKFGILKLEQEAACKYGRSVGKVYLKDKLPSQLPWDWTGYCGLDILVLYDTDMSQCNTSQLKAIEQWVRNGGKVLMILSSHPLSYENPLASCLPFEILDSGQYSIPTGTAATLKLGGTASSEVVAWPVRTNDSKLCDFITIEQDTAVLGVGYCGFGRIGLLSFDPATLPNAANHQSSQFWIHLLSSVLMDPVIKDQQSELPDMSGNKSQRYNQFQYNLQQIQTMSVRDIIPNMNAEEEENFNNYSHRYGIGLEQAGSNAVMEYLLNIPQMRPLSIWWVILLLILLAVLLGPVDYIVLKKLDRQPLTWLTCSFWIVVFTVGAYYGVQALRSGELQYRSVTVTDAIAADDSTWSATHAGLFAPKSDKYQLDKFDGKQWWSAISPEQREIYSYRGGQNASRNVFCMQYDGANIPYALPVNIWTMQCLLCEEPVERSPIRATVKRQQNEIVAEISNLSGEPLEKGYIVFADSRIFEFGSLDPIATKTFKGALKVKQVWSNNNNNRHYGTIKIDNPILNTEEAYIAKGSLGRTKALGAMIERGAAVVCVEMNTREPTIQIKDKKCEYTNRKLYRLMVFPEEL
ncbi:MAG: hypothetical protein ABFR90_11045 [Planctomycetota bacterium]